MRRGFVLVTTVISATVLVAFVGLVVDAGYLQLVKSRMQTAADAAAIGGVEELNLGDLAGVVAAARADSAANGFTDGVNNVTVAVHNPPSSGAYSTDSTAVEAIVNQRVNTLFMGVLGFTSTNVGARAVARQGSSPTCMYILDPAASSAFSISGGATVRVNCGMIVDSTSNTALSASGGASVTATAINIAGNYSSSGGASLSPAPTIHAPAQSDPLAYLSPPTFGACDHTNYKLSGGAVQTVSPGVFCGGISLSGGSSLTFNPGTYILLGGGLSVSGGSRLSGSGVTFYNTKDATHSVDSISFSGGTVASLSAPTTGALAGILVFQDRSVTNKDSSLTGGTGCILTGALYFPGTAMSYSGGSTATYTIIVAKTISFSGGSTLNADYSSLPAGSPAKAGATLSE